MRFLMIVFAFCFLVSGCAPKVIQPVVPIEWKKAEERGRTGEEEKSKIEGRKVEKVDETKIEEEDILKRQRITETKIPDTVFKDVLFDFDSYIIKTEYYQLLDSISEWLKLRKDKNVVIEGHCDERGTYEYNFVLGQKRAEAVREYLIRKGVDSRRLKVISYGKERPLDPRHTEEAWAKNRRAHFRLE